MKKYIISIESEDGQRLKFFFQQPLFASAHEEFKKVGIKGDDLTVKEYFELGVVGHKKALTPGELGCTLSHLKALKNFLASSDEYAIVFEDDAIQDCDFTFTEIEQNLKALDLKSCFFFSLGGIQLFHSQKVRGKFLSHQMLERNVLKVHPFYYQKFVSAYAYIVDRKMAELLLQYHSLPQIFDHWSGVYYLEPNINLYATYLFDHPIVTDDEVNSYLHEERVQYALHASKTKIKSKIYQPILKRLIQSTLKSYRVK